MAIVDARPATGGEELGKRPLGSSATSLEGFKRAAMASHGEVLEDVEFGLSMAACRTESRNGVAASPGADSIRSTTDAGVDDFIKAPQLPVWQRFLPALIFYPIWLRTMVAHDMWNEAYSDGWPMAIAMIAGSLIAGSTPLGGGVVAFPVSVLVLKLSPQEGRDFASLIQSIGMVAAAFLITSCKAHLLHRELIVFSTVAGTWGVAIGFSLRANPLVLNVAFTTVILSFSIIYIYLNEYHLAIVAKRENNPAPAGDVSEYLTDSQGTPQRTVLLRRCILVVFAVGGGVLSAQLGSGSDTACFVFTVLVWNSISPKHDLIDLSVATASSVVIMAVHTVEVAAMVLIQGGSTERVYHCLACAAPIVVLGAPLGSLLLRPSLIKILQRIFYLLALVQFVSFAYLKVQTRLWAWVGILCGVSAAVLGVAAHVYFTMYRMRRG